MGDDGGSLYGEERLKGYLFKKLYPSSLRIFCKCY
jgi:hypothetical protein